jgi:hypothetical protein
MPTSQIVSGAITAIVLIVLTLPWLRHKFRKSDPDFVRLVSWALVAKILASIARYFVAYQIYGGVADSAQYYNTGVALVPQFRQFDFHANVGKVIGTGVIKIFTGLVFAATGVSDIGGYFIYSWLGFLGLWLFFRAFRLAVPEGDVRRYFWLVFLLPSMLFWPSEIGKEAWMTLGLGLSAYGAARILTYRPFGYVLVLLGCTETALVRPLVTALLLAALVMAFLLRRSQVAAGSGHQARRGGQIVGIVVLSAALLVGVTQANTFFSKDGVESGGSTGISAIISGTAARTTQGGSHFAPARLSAPWTIPYAVLSVTFRPFPWEARNVQGLLASGEGAFLLYMTWRSRKRLRNLWKWMRFRPYIALCLLYSLLFAFGFSAVGNFGILARERVMQFPFFVVILALPDHRPGEAETEGGDPDPAEKDVIGGVRISAMHPAALSRAPLATDSELVPVSPGRIPPPPSAAPSAPP